MYIKIVNNGNSFTVTPDEGNAPKTLGILQELGCQITDYHQRAFGGSSNPLYPESEIGYFGLIDASLPNDVKLREVANQLHAHFGGYMQWTNDDIFLITEDDDSLLLP